jgi:17beta-estradiol 17-dehydrogenase / very-long-chain 3-oxoacyl-CoA reductase
MTRLLLPILQKSQPALMLFMSSAVTETTSIGTSIYSAAKAYIEMLTQCLQLEFKYQGWDIECMSLTCGLVATASSGRSEKDVSFQMCTAADFAKSALNSVGCGHVKVAPYPNHWLIFGFIKSLPKWLQEKLVLSMVGKAREQMKAARRKTS